jgi:hypothetical protein
MKITTTPCDPKAPDYIDAWKATDQGGRRFYAPTEREAVAMALDYNKPLKRTKGRLDRLMEQEGA